MGLWILNCNNCPGYFNFSFRNPLTYAEATSLLFFSLKQHHQYFVINTGTMWGGALVSHAPSCRNTWILRDVGPIDGMNQRLPPTKLPSLEINLILQLFYTFQILLDWMAQIMRVKQVILSNDIYHFTSLTMQAYGKSLLGPSVSCDVVITWIGNSALHGGLIAALSS